MTLSVIKTMYSLKKNFFSLLFFNAFFKLWEVFFNCKYLALFFSNIYYLYYLFICKRFIKALQTKKPTKFSPSDTKILKEILGTCYTVIKNLRINQITNYYIFIFFIFIYINLYIIFINKINIIL